MTLARPYMGLLGGQAILVTLVAGFCVLPSSVAFSEDTIDSRKRPSSGVSAGGFVGRSERDPGVVAHWRFQKGIAGSGANSSQLIEDSSGNNHHGRAVGGPRFHSVELPSTNLALAFDGHDDRIAVADARDFQLTRSFTIEAWIEVAFYPESSSKLSHIAFRGDNRLGFDPWFLAVTESGQLRFLIANGLNKASVVLSPEPLPTRKLIHVAAVLDDEVGTQSLFIDGERVATTKTKIRACGPLGGTGAGIGIGGRQAHSNQGFRGSIGELRISARALTEAQFLPLETE